MGIFKMTSRISSKMNIALLLVFTLLSTSLQQSQTAETTQNGPNSVISHGELANISKYTIFPLRQQPVNTNCPSYCRQTNCPNGFCSDCVDKYFASNGMCYACSSTCRTCQNAASMCTSCNRGFYIQGNNCETCSKGCSDCSSESQCQTCTSGYFKSSVRPGYCVACSNNCSTCSSFDVCTSCGLMWKLEGTKCIEKTFFEKLITYLWIMIFICVFCCVCIPLMICCCIKSSIENFLRGGSVQKGSYGHSNDNVF